MQPYGGPGQPQAYGSGAPPTFSTDPTAYASQAYSSQAPPGPAYGSQAPPGPAYGSQAPPGPAYGSQAPPYAGQAPYASAPAPYAPTPAPYAPFPSYGPSYGQQQQQPPQQPPAGQQYPPAPHAAPGHPQQHPQQPPQQQQAYGSGGYGSGGYGSGGQAPQAQAQAPAPQTAKAEAEAPSAHSHDDYDPVTDATEYNKGSSSGGLLSKLSLKMGQMGGAGVGIAKQKVNNIARRAKYSTELQPPPGGYCKAKFEHLAGVVKFGFPDELELLYYDFCKHVGLPDVRHAPQAYEPAISLQEFEDVMPQPPPHARDFGIVVQAVHTVFRFGEEEVRFPSWAKAMSIICRGTPEEKMPMLFDIFVDQRQGAVTVDSFRFVFGQLQALQLACPSAGGPATAQDLEALVAALFARGPAVGLQEFRGTALAQCGGGRAWAVLLDCVGLFPFFYFSYFSAAEAMAAGRLPEDMLPHKEGFLLKSFKGPLGRETWNRHWSVLENGFLWYYPAHNQFDEVARVLFLGDVTVRESRDAGDPPYCFELAGGAYKRKFCADDEEELRQWLWAVEHSISQAKHANHSFAAPRRGINAKWYIDGKDVYADMLEAMEGAREQIFITDWFFSPEVHMLRHDPATGAPLLKPAHRLENVLLRKAREGVQIYVLPWSETKIAIDLASANVKAKLEKLSTNIKVLCHPLVAPIKWSHHQKTLVVDQALAFVGGLDLCFGRWDDQQHCVTDNGEVQRFPGKDYYNPGICEFSNVHDAWTDLLDRERHPRMPWHDIHARVDGRAARDVAFNFIQRWNHHRDDLNQHKYLLPKRLEAAQRGTAEVQVVRSVCEWSAGVRVPETSIYNAYLQAIEEAEHMVYIENQFFISATAGRPVENEISAALMRKVCAAAREGRTFRVLVVTPVNPEGSYETTATVRYIMWWQYRTICRGAASMLSQFQREFPELDPAQYFSFYNVKSWAPLNDRLVAEQVYVHAKLMVVDDRVAIIGSANINDRSMLGVRDSEIAVVVRDAARLQGRMAGRPFEVARFAHDLRVNCMLEHLGLPAAEHGRVQDPACPEFMALWQQTARTNSEAFGEVFYKARSAPASPENLERMRQVRGHLVDFDQALLTDEEMKAQVTDLDVFVTTDDVFT